MSGGCVQLTSNGQRCDSGRVMIRFVGIRMRAERMRSSLLWMTSVTRPTFQWAIFT